MEKFIFDIFLFGKIQILAFFISKNTNMVIMYETALAMELKVHDHDLYYFDSKKVGK